MWVTNSTMLAQKWIGLITVLVKNKKQNKTKAPYLPTKNELTTLWSCPKAHAIIDRIAMLLKARKKIVSLFSLLARQHVGYSTEQMLGSCAGFWALWNCSVRTTEGATILTLKILFRNQIKMISTSSLLGITLIFGLTSLANPLVPWVTKAHRMPGVLVAMRKVGQKEMRRKCSQSECVHSMEHRVQRWWQVSIVASECGIWARVS